MSVVSLKQVIDHKSRVTQVRYMANKTPHVYIIHTASVIANISREVSRAQDRRVRMEEGGEMGP